MTYYVLRTPTFAIMTLLSTSDNPVKALKGYTVVGACTSLESAHAVKRLLEPRPWRDGRILNFNGILVKGVQ